MHRIVVNLRIANVFNGFFETQKSTQNGEKNAKFCAWRTRGRRVYHVGINHDAALSRLSWLRRRMGGIPPPYPTCNKPPIHLLWVHSGKSQNEHMWAAAPPEPDTPPGAAKTAFTKGDGCAYTRTSISGDPIPVFPEPTGRSRMQAPEKPPPPSFRKKRPDRLKRTLHR